MSSFIKKYTVPISGVRAHIFKEKASIDEWH